MCDLGISSLVFFHGVGTSTDMKPYIFVVFQGGGPDPLSPLWIRTCSLKDYFTNIIRVSITLDPDL